ncbi:MAG: sigma 54-interacting transcriptional regulator [Holophaga sp.]|nr:sigma 54-interacting transcriptional regulator [Holophaga sp.]
MPTELRAPILRSWIRCKQIGVDPNGGKGSLVLPMVELNRSLKSNAVLIAMVRDLLQEVCWSSATSGFIFFLTDKDANLLLIIGDKRVAKEFEELINFSVGVNWGEGSVGTTAVSLAFDEHNSVPWMSEEKYCFLLKEKACAAVPIKSRNGSVVGVLGAATDLDGLTGSAPSVFDFLVVAAKAVNGRYQCFEVENSLGRTRKSMSLLLDAIPEGILITDQGGKIMEVNGRFGTLLGLDLSGAVGKRADLLIPPASLAPDEEWAPGKRRPRHGNPPGHPSRTQKMTSRKVQFKDADGLQEYSLHILQECQEKRQKAPDENGFHAKWGFADILGASGEIRQALEQAMGIAGEPYDVLIEGKTGTGKEMFAQAIHNASGRAAFPFVPVNCGAIPEELAESELCGYECGAFTGAHPQGFPGKLGLADGGTLFLDEIGEMPPGLQVKLLRVLQEKKYMRLGGVRPMTANLRVIAATNRDLETLLRTGRFREDLFWRLNVLNLRIPSLSEREGDILFLADHFLKQHAGERSIAYSLSEEARNLLLAYPWPGNVRELQNTLMGAVVQARDGVIRPRHLPGRILEGARLRDAGKSASPWQEAERSLISHAIATSGGNLTQAAKLVGISRVTLYNKIRKYHMAD